MIDLSKYAGLVFDMDGTLIDSMPAHINAWRQTCEKYDVPYDYEWFYQLGGVPTLETVDIMNQTFGLNLDRYAVAADKMAFYDENSDKIVALPETLAVVKAWYGKKPLAVGTGARHDAAVAMLEQTGLLQYFDTVVGSDDVPAHKPAPDTFIQAARNLGCEPTECVVFEDTAIGKEAAENGHMPCIMVLNGHIDWPA